MGRIANLSEMTFSGDTLVRTGRGTLFSMTLSWSGAAAGQAVTLRDGTDQTAPFMVPFVLDAAQGTIIRQWDNGKEFLNGLFIDAQGSGQVQGEITIR